MSVRTTFGLYLSLSGLTACQHELPVEKPQPVAVHCARAQRQALDEKLVVSGHLEPPPGGDLPAASQVAGRIVTVAVHEGEQVKSGQVIATVDDLVSRDGVRQAEAALARATASQANSDANLERVRALVARGIAARQELDDAVARAEAEKQGATAAQATLDLARRTLGRVQVRAAFGGVVTRIWRGPGALVDGTDTTPIVQLAAATGAELVAEVTEKELGRIQPGQSAEVRLLALTGPIAGTVRTRSRALEPATGLGSVRIALEAAPAGLLMGGHGQAFVITQHRDGVLVVPARAVRGAIADGAEVVVCAGGVASVRRVGVGYRDAERLEVVSGIGPDDKLAQDHVLGLDDGTRLQELE